MKLLSFDPSGNYDEGKGTSGYAITDTIGSYYPVKLGDISAKDYDCRQSYWFAHKELIEVVSPEMVVIESYRLFGHKSKEQTGSSLETPQLIGFMEMVCWEMKIPVYYQDPSTKTRHKDEVLVETGIVEKKGNKFYYKGELTNLHKRDALRHAIYFAKYNKVMKELRK